MIIVSIDSYFFCFAYCKATIACPSLLISLNRIIKSHWTFAHVVVGWTVSYLPLKEFGKYCDLWQSVYSPLITHTFINYWMCKTKSSLSWYLGNCIHNTFAKGTTIMGVSQPYFERVWGWNSHSRNGELGVFWDSQNFKVRLQGSKHLALKRSLYHWKAIKL